MCTKEEASVTERTFSVTEGSEYEDWELVGGEGEAYENDHIISEQRPDIEPKTIPIPENTYKVVCLSFLDKSATAPIASRVFDESWRTLAPGGLLYVVDNRGIVSKVPKMRQMLSRVIQPTSRLKSHDARIREIVEANGLENAFAGKVVRWMGMKPAP